MDTSGQIDTFILDFEKAFDTPPYELLKCTLHAYGIGGKTLILMLFYDFDSKYLLLTVVNLIQHRSCLGFRKKQFLGPLVCFLYINVISYGMKHDCFADDCICYHDINDVGKTAKP